MLAGPFLRHRLRRWSLARCDGVGLVLHRRIGRCDGSRIGLFAPDLPAGTDGLFRYTTGVQFRVTALRGTPEEACRALIDLVRLPVGTLQDDVAVVVCQVPGSVRSPSRADQGIARRPGVSAHRRTDQGAMRDGRSSGRPSLRSRPDAWFGLQWRPGEATGSPARLTDGPARRRRDVRHREIPWRRRRMNRPRDRFLVLLVLLAAASRLVPHPPNFAPVAAVARLRGASLSGGDGRRSWCPCRHSS